MKRILLSSWFVCLSLIVSSAQMNERVSKLEGGEQKGSSSSNSMPSGFPIQFHGASLQQVLDLYEVVKERTVLQHPSLPQVLFTLDATPKNASEAAGPGSVKN